MHYEVRSQEAHAPEHEEIHCRKEEPATRTKRRISVEVLAAARRAESGLSGLQISEVEDDTAETVEGQSRDPVPIT